MKAYSIKALLLQVQQIEQLKYGMFNQNQKILFKL
jgi:hypothetical protein